LVLVLKYAAKLSIKVELAKEFLGHKKIFHCILTEDGRQKTEDGRRKFVKIKQIIVGDLVNSHLKKKS
jgi:hypothetical protein